MTTAPAAQTGVWGTSAGREVIDYLLLFAPCVLTSPQARYRTWKSTAEPAKRYHSS